MSPGKLFLVSVALLLSALVLNATTQLGLVNVLFWLGLVLFIGAYATFFVRSETRPERRWRGRVVEYDRSSWWERLRRWLR